jgi:hypothetical protein
MGIRPDTILTGSNGRAGRVESFPTTAAEEMAMASEHSQPKKNLIARDFAMFAIGESVAATGSRHCLPAPAV